MTDLYYTVDTDQSRIKIIEEEFETFYISKNHSFVALSDVYTKEILEK